MASRYAPDVIAAARAEWRLGVPVSEICHKLNINNVQVVYKWRTKYQWDEPDPLKAVQLALSIRINSLVELGDKTPAHYHEISLLTTELLRLDKREAYDNGEPISAGRPMGVKTGEGKRERKKAVKNDVSGVTSERLRELEQALLYPHQLEWLVAGRDPETYRTRFILKPRQVGATFTFALEALFDAIENGTNQIFISMTRANAEIFKAYAFIIAREHLNIELKGNPTVLSNGAELHYISPNSNAQSRSGNVYFDEVFWTKHFVKMRDLAAPMATLTGLRRTYLSTPSAISHDAYEIWNGEHYTKHHKNAVIDVSDLTALAHGRLDIDGVWRWAAPIEDIVARGWDKVSLAELRLETPDPLVYANIYQCKFIDDSASVFKLGELLACGVEIESAWRGVVDYDAARPVGTAPCTAGYDPAGTGDNASFTILTKPAHAGEPFRRIKHYEWRGISARVQSDTINTLADYNYNLEYLGVDATGAGAFVCDFISGGNIRTIERVQYSPEYKTIMVQKALSVIQARRFEYDASDTALALAFLTVYQTVTDAGGKITYQSRRSNKVGHGDAAWACMHAFMCEPLAVDKQRGISFAAL